MEESPKKFGWMLPFPKDKCNTEQMVECLDYVAGLGWDFVYAEVDEPVYGVDCVTAILLFKTLDECTGVSLDERVRGRFFLCTGQRTLSEYTSLSPN